MTVSLYEVTDVTIENVPLIEQASVQSEKRNGKACLEMWVRIPGKGDWIFRRAIPKIQRIASTSKRDRMRDYDSLNARPGKLSDLPWLRRFSLCAAP